MPKKERWLPVAGQLKYYVSDCGSVRSTYGHWKLLKPRVCRKGYRTVKFSGEREQVARLVATAFIRPLLKGEVVRHLDGDKANDHVSNLRIENESPFAPPTIRPKRTPRVLLFDIETRPNVAYVWGKYEQDVISYVEEWGMLSVAWKWLGEKKVHVVSARRNPKDDRRIAKQLHKLFKQADVLVAHNGDAFDIKKAKARFIGLGLEPIGDIPSIDTKKLAKQQFAFNSNALADLGETLQIGKKVSTGGWDLWKGCLEDKPASWDRMERYNKQDVVLLEKLYLKLRPWVRLKLHQGLLEGKDVNASCPSCGSERIKRHGYQHGARNIKQKWQCYMCDRQWIGAVVKEVA